MFIRTTSILPTTIPKLGVAVSGYSQTVREMSKSRYCPECFRFLISTGCSRIFFYDLSLATSKERAQLANKLVGKRPAGGSQQRKR